MIILRNRLYSDDFSDTEERPKRRSLREIHSRGKGMGRAGLSIGAHVGRVAGSMKANKSDEEGKSDIEIMKDASKRAGRAGAAAGAMMGLITGGALGYGAKKGLEHLADQAHESKITSKGLKIAGKTISPVAKFVSNLPIVGRRVFYHPEKGKWATGKAIEKIGNVAGNVAKKAGNIENITGKVEAGLRKAALPVAIGIGVLGAAKGAIKGKRKGRSAAEKLTMNRLSRREEQQNSNKKNVY